MDLDQLKERVADGRVHARQHPAAPLTIYNYADKVQWDRTLWDDITEQCRGLILDADGRVVARPFRKFFNLEEHLWAMNRTIPDGPFRVTEKVDGSLGIMYWIDGRPYIASRGSFTSEQATVGSAMLGKYNEHAVRLDPSKTYLFEIVYPANRVVVDYGSDRRLILLAVIDTASGIEEPVHPGLWPDIVEDHGFADVAMDRDGSVLARVPGQENREGFVLAWPDGTRVKVKFEEYKRLHRLVTGVTARRIWESMAAGDSLAPMYDRVPDEFFAWAKDIEAYLTTEYRQIEEACKAAFAALPANELEGREQRKATAMYFLSFPEHYRPVLFSMLDGGDYAPAIWRHLKPVAEQPFKKVRE